MREKKLLKIPILFELAVRSIPDTIPRPRSPATLRESVSDYLATHPPNEQVTQLRDAVTALIHIDEQVADEEALIADELNGLFDRYIGSYEDATNYAVVLAPQAKAQEEELEEDDEEGECDDEDDVVAATDIEDL